MPRRRDIARIDVRIDLGAISNARAQELLVRYGRLCSRIVSDYPGYERDELLAIAQIGVLEAALTHDAARGSPEPQWVARIVRQRVQVVVERRRTQLARETPEADPLTNGKHDPERLMLRRTLYRCIALLPPRESIVLTARIRGETFEEIAATCGITSKRAHQHAARAIARIRAWVQG